MPSQGNKGLVGEGPEGSPVALLLIDLINDLEFAEGEQLLAQARPILPRIAALKARAKAQGIPIIYVNDNFGRWQSNFAKLVSHCLEDDVRGQPLAQQLAPSDDDYFVLKPKHSGFFATPLDLLLDHLQVNTLILTGIAGNICVLFTANDAHMRGFTLHVPADCVASNRAADNEAALRQMARVLDADLTPAEALDLAALQRAAGERGTTKNRPG